MYNTAKLYEYFACTKAKVYKFLNTLISQTFDASLEFLKACTSELNCNPHLYTTLEKNHSC